MSENENLKSKAGVLGFLSLALIALFLFVGNSLINNDAIDNDENSDVVVIDESNEAIKVTAEKFVPNEDDAEDDVEEGIVITGDPPASEE